MTITITAFDELFEGRTRYRISFTPKIYEIVAPNGNPDLAAQSLVDHAVKAFFEEIRELVDFTEMDLKEYISKCLLAGKAPDLEDFKRQSKRPKIAGLDIRFIEDDHAHRPALRFEDRYHGRDRFRYQNIWEHFADDFALYNRVQEPREVQAIVPNVRAG